MIKIRKRILKMKIKRKKKIIKKIKRIKNWKKKI